MWRTSPAHDRAELIALVAELYYLEELDQNQIAERIGTSRSNVSRLLTEARRKGVVEIRINRPLGRDGELEKEFAERMGIDEARVLAGQPGIGADESLRRVGSLAARYLQEMISDGLSIGVSQGTSLDAMVDGLSLQRSYSVDVVQLLGGLSSVSPDLSGHEIGRRLAQRLGGTFYYLHAPAIVDSPETRNALIKQPGIEDTLGRGASVDVAFVGVGALGVGTSKDLFAEAYLTRREQQDLLSSGPVGDVCARLFDIEGRSCKVSVEQRVIGISLKALRQIPKVVAVARGPEKAAGLLGALRGRFANALITDEPTALEILRLEATA